MKIKKVSIENVIPKNFESATQSQINKFEELALFLDCQTIQKIIGKLCKRIRLKKNIPYEDFDSWKKDGIINDTLSREEKQKLNDLDSEIEHLENTQLAISDNDKKRLRELEDKRLKWLNPFYTFSKAVKNSLKPFNAEAFYQVLIKAVVCGEVRGVDLSNKFVKRAGARKAIYSQREAYWLYQTEHPARKRLMGYGLTGRSLSEKASLQSTRNKITTYKDKLKQYNAELTSS